MWDSQGYLTELSPRLDFHDAQHKGARPQRVVSALAKQRNDARPVSACCIESLDFVSYGRGYLSAFAKIEIRDSTLFSDVFARHGRKNPSHANPGGRLSVTRQIWAYVSGFGEPSFSAHHTRRSKVRILDQGVTPPPIKTES